MHSLSTPRENQMGVCVFRQKMSLRDTVPVCVHGAIVITSSITVGNYLLSKIDRYLSDAERSSSVFADIVNWQCFVGRGFFLMILCSS